MTDRQARRRRSTDRGRLVAERIRQARIAQGLSQKELGGLYGCSAAAISQLEKDASGIGVDRLESLARILGRPLYWFLEESGASEPRYIPHPIASLHEIQLWLSRFVPVYDRVIVGGAAEPVDWVAAGRTANPEQLRGYCIPGLSCEPDVREGDTVLVSVTATPRSGDIVLGVLAGREVLGRCDEGEGQGRRYDCPSGVYPDEAFHVVGIAVRVSRSVAQRETGYDMAEAKPSLRAGRHIAPDPVLLFTYQEAVAHYLQGFASLDWTSALGDHAVAGQRKVTRFNYSRN